MNFVPSQPYLTTFLKEHHNLDEATLNSSIWPVSTYSMLFFSLPCGILASFFPSFTLFLGVSSRILLYVLLLCLTSVLSVQVVEILFGLFIVVDGLALVSASCLGAPESSYAYISSGIMVSRELALVLSSLVGQLFYEVIYDSDDGSLEYLFVASLVSCCLAFLWFALRIRITAPSKGSKAPADYKSTISSLSSLYASKPSLYLLTFILCISYASFLTAADYNFMLLTSFNSSNLGVIATSLSLFGAIGAFLAGLYYERYKRGLLEIALIGMASTSAFAYLGLAGDTYWVVVVCVVVPWAVFQTSYTLTTILVTTTLGGERRLERRLERRDSSISLTTILTTFTRRFAHRRVPRLSPSHRARSWKALESHCSQRGPGKRERVGWEDGGLLRVLHDFGVYCCGRAALL